MEPRPSISQGGVYWLETGDPLGSAPGFRRPYVVVQSDLYNDTTLQTVVVCGLTSNVRRANAPGNILLDEGEGNLPKRSVVNVTQLITVDRRELTDYIGSLSARRIREIYRGLQLLLEPLSD